MCSQKWWNVSYFFLFFPPTKVFRIFRSPSYLGTMCFSLPFIPNNQRISAQLENTWILPCALFWKSRDFRDIKNYIRERFKKEGEKLTTTGNMGQHIVFFVFAFLHIFQNFPCTLGEKRKNVSFFSFFLAPFPNNNYFKKLGSLPSYTSVLNADVCRCYVDN